MNMTKDNPRLPHIPRRIIYLSSHDGMFIRCDLTSFQNQSDAGDDVNTSFIVAGHQEDAELRIELVRNQATETHVLVDVFTTDIRDQFGFYAKGFTHEISPVPGANIANRSSLIFYVSNTFLIIISNDTQTYANDLLDRIMEGNSDCRATLSLYMEAIEFVGRDFVEQNNLKEMDDLKRDIQSLPDVHADLWSAGDHFNNWRNAYLGK